MTGARDALAGRGFGAAADHYVRGRPDYPAEAVAWLLDASGPDVVDVGAGTGKLTAAVLAAGRRVAAVDPDAGMLAALRDRLPAVPAHVGAAEALPLPDRSADAVLFGQAWHWVDVPVASAEVARVLRPGGVLGLVWNIRDESEDWVAQLTALMHGSTAERMVESDAVEVGSQFGPLDRRTWGWSRPMSPEDVVAMAASRSYLIALPEREREALLARIRDLLATHPDTAGRAIVELPYRTEAYRCRLR